MENKINLIDQYDEGVVCYIDILGFGKFSFNENNLGKIKSIFSTNKTIKNMQENNNFIGKVLQISDSLFITAKLSDFKESSFFSSILSLICLIRESVVKTVGTDIRCGITYGKFIHLDDGTIFGPGVTRAVLLEELKIQDEKLISLLPNHPAMILIDNNILDSPLNKDNELKDFVFKDDSKRFKNLENGFFLVNPYYFIFEIKMYTSILWNQKLDKNKLVRQWSDIIEKNKEYQEKYWLMKQMLNLFSNDVDLV